MITFTDSSRHVLSEALQVVAVIKSLDDKNLSGEVDDFAPPGSPLRKLTDDLPDAPIALEHTIRAALSCARGSLEALSNIYLSGQSPNIVTLTTHARSALVGASRVVFILGPTKPEDRRRNAVAVLRQEASSLRRYLDAVDEVKHAKGLKPPAWFSTRMQQSISGFLGGDKASGEWRALAQVAPLVGEALSRANRGDGQEAGVIAEHVTYMWHAYSGEAHGFAWPRLLAGDFVTDFHMISSITHLAFDLAIRFTTPE